MQIFAFGGFFVGPDALGFAPLDESGQYCLEGLSFPPGFSYYFQVVYSDSAQPMGFGFSNAVQIDFPMKP